jgi:hypothetical protein
MKGNESTELKERDSSTEIQRERKLDFVEELALRSADDSHKRYGNMKVLLETDRILITLGPDCTSISI